MKNKKINLENIAGGFNIKRAFGRAASSARNGLTKFIESETGQKLGRKGKDVLNSILGKIEKGVEKGIDKKVGQVENYIDSKF